MIPKRNLILITLSLLAIFQLKSVATTDDDPKNVNLENALPCCVNDENRFEGRTCKGNFTKLLNCSNGKYMLDPTDNPNDEFFIDENEELIDTTTLYVMAPKDKYCISKKNTKYVAVVCFLDRALDATENKVHPVVICQGISVFFLVLTFIIYCIVKDLRDLQGKCLMHMIVNLATSYVVLATIQTNTSLSNFWCTTVAFLLYASMLVTFLWLNVVSFNVWRLVRLRNLQTSDKNLYYLYCLYAYGLMGITFIITLTLHRTEGDHLKPGIALTRCWFSGTSEIWAFFYAPVLFLLVINIAFYIDTVYLLWSDYKSMAACSTNSIKSHRFKCLLYIKLFIVMGLSWIFEPLSFLSTKHNGEQGLFWTITDYINLLQGILIFIILIATRKRALRGLARTNFCGFRICPVYFATLAPDDECEEIIQNVEESTLAPPAQNA